MKIDWQRSAAIIFCIMAAAVCGWLTFKYLLGIVMPFAFAWLVATAVSPAAGWLAGRTKISRKFCSLVLLVIFLGIIIMLLVFLARRLVLESGRLLEWLRYGGGGAVISEGFESAADLFGDTVGRLPVIGEAFGLDEVEGYIGALDKMLVNFIGEVAGALSAWLSGTVFGLVSKLPGALMTLLVTLISCFYFTLDISNVNRAATALLPKRASDALPRLRSRLYGAVGRWVRAYIILFAITAFTLLLGFIVLGVDYPVLLAIAGAMLDILPVLGTGTMLIPWGLYALATHDFRLGFGLLILYAVSVIVHQTAEPKVLGGSLGIHPIITLAALYTGYRLFGVAGMILLPPVIMVAVSAFVSKTKTKD